MNLPNDNSLCKGCGEIYPYRTETCPVCHAECVSLDEYRLGKAEGFHGGEIVKWLACLFMLTLVGMVVIMLSRNVSDSRLLGKRDMLNEDIHKLWIEKKCLDDELVPARKIVAEAEAVKSEKERLRMLSSNLQATNEQLAARERAVATREHAVWERERKAEELSVLETQIRKSKGLLAGLEGEVQTRSNDLENINTKIGDIKGKLAKLLNELAIKEQELANMGQSTMALEDRLKALSVSVATQSAVWTNLAHGIVLFEAETNRLSQLRSETMRIGADIENRRDEFRLVTNAIVQLGIQRDLLNTEQGRVEKTIERLRSLTNELARAAVTATAEVVKLRNQKTELEADVEVAKQQNDVAARLKALGPEIDAMKKTVSDVGGTVTNFDMAIGVMQTELSKAVEAAKERLAGREVNQPDPKEE